MNRLFVLYWVIFFSHFDSLIHLRVWVFIMAVDKISLVPHVFTDERSFAPSTLGTKV